MLSLTLYSLGMNRNTESHFSELPQVDIQRSIFDRSSSHKTSFNVGDVIPFFVDEVLPGDTFNVTTSCVVRLQTPLTPIMDNIYLDTYYFYVPNRILWTHWKEFMGENTSGAWIPQTEYTIPKMRPPEDGWNVGTIADYLGIPPGVHEETGKQLVLPSALPFRAYAMICDQWFRDQNLSDPLDIYLGDAVTQGTNGTDPDMTNVPAGGYPFKAAKYHDLFSSSLPSPQKGVSVGLFPSNSYQSIGNIGSYYTHYAPVVPLANYTISSNVGMSLKIPGGSTSRYLSYDSSNYALKMDQSASSSFRLYPDNLFADLSGTGITINELRQAFQLQKFFEKNARAGTRYREILKEHFGVTSSDARMQIPEYLGGHRFPLSIHQVSNTSQGDNSFLGDLGAMSNTSDVHEDFTKSFEEHGYILGLCVVRYDHSYPQGVEKMWLRTGKLDFYFPVFANLGEQMVFRNQIYYQAEETSSTSFSPVWGYQEAWSEYRYKPSRVSGEMRPGVDNSLATWHLSDYYNTIPYLSDRWIREDKSNVDRVLSVTSSVANQVFADFYVKNICTRPMPVYSIPGLIDHH